MSTSEDLRALEAEVRALREDLLAAEAARSDAISGAHPAHRQSAANLVHYVELRHHDIRALQASLSVLGLSSLGRSEPNVLATVEAVLALLDQLTGLTPPAPAAGIDLGDGHLLLAENADRLLGPAPADRSTRIMVTLPSEAADDGQIIARWVADGMDLVRVNCAHDDAEAWDRMITHVRRSTGADRRRCRVAIDLGGPKLRTGPLQPGPRVLRVSPRRDKSGHVVEPALVWLTTNRDHAVAGLTDRPIAAVPVEDPAWVERRRRGDGLELWDSRGAHRNFEVLEVAPGRCLVSTKQTTYVMTGLKIICPDVGGEDAVAIGELPEVEQAHRVHRGDQIILTRSLAPQAPTRGNTTHYIGCSLAEAFEHARPGQQVWLDDGKIGGLIDRVDDDEIALTATDVRDAGANLKAGKGINLPETDLPLDALTPQDLVDLEFVARHADVVNFSFVRCCEDVEAIQGELDRLDSGNLGVVLKIENVAAFENLPELLLTAMRSPKIGVMIARGDLAVEVGFERLAEVQEEVLWACEAAHVPVIWATQVLDSLARKGQPSRAEVTDAAMAERAECVMLNKGPHISEAINVLDSILTRMQGHQDKKRSLLRRLHAWDNLAPTRQI